MPRSLKTFLILGRVSNLPTVWSNCLAASLLAGGSSPVNLALAMIGGTLLYTGGMFLNDAFDVEFDVAHRPERPIPSGAISRRTVWISGFVLLFCGVLSQLPLGPGTITWSLALAATILLYDAVHKRLAVAPVLMAGCRYLLYLMAASSSAHGAMPEVLFRALALALYIAGLSCLARVESKRGPFQRWPLALLVAPLVAALLAPGALTIMTGAVGAAFIVWLVLAVRRALYGQNRNIGAGVGRLLAGIVLSDWLATTSHGPLASPVFVGLFLLALAAQRFAPAS